MLIDTHAHVNFKTYKDDGDEVVKKALKENIWMINVGSEKDTSRRAVEYAQKYEGVFAAVGLHPTSLYSFEYEEKVDAKETVKFETEGEEFDAERYRQLAQNPKTVAIGEIGLDYYRLENMGNKLAPEDLKAIQREGFIKQLELAHQMQKPVIIHCRDAHNDMIEILKDWQGKIGGVLHSFTGRWSQAEQYLDMGFYLGFNGIITFARDYDRVVREMPIEKLLLETDCPYLTPNPYRGQRNEPAYVKYVALKVAELRGIKTEEVAEITTKNAKQLFKI